MDPNDLVKALRSASLIIGILAGVSIITFSASVMLGPKGGVLVSSGVAIVVAIISLVPVINKN